MSSNNLCNRIKYINFRFSFFLDFLLGETYAKYIPCVNKKNLLRLARAIKSGPPLSCVCMHLLLAFTYRHSLALQYYAVTGGQETQTAFPCNTEKRLLDLIKDAAAVR